MLVSNTLAQMASMNPISAIRNTVTSSIDSLNCVKIAIVEEYYPETRTAKVNLVNKVFLGTNEDDIQLTGDYPPLYPRVMFLGTVDNGIDYKLQAGDEVIVFFCDREIQSWWDSGEISQLDDFRTHSMSDCIALAGIRSMPKTTITDDNLNIYSKNGIINLVGNTVITGDVTINGNLNVTGDVTISGISFLNHVHGNGNQGSDTTAPKG